MIMHYLQPWYLVILEMYLRGDPSIERWKKGNFFS